MIGSDVGRFFHILAGKDGPCERAIDVESLNFCPVATGMRM